MKRKVFRTQNSIGHIEYRDDEPDIPVNVPQENEPELLLPTGIQLYAEGEQEQQETDDIVDFMLTPEVKLLQRERKAKEIKIERGTKTGPEPLLPIIE